MPVAAESNILNHPAVPVPEAATVRAGVMSAVAVPDEAAPNAGSE
jgi:hypothetical protein